MTKENSNIDSLINSGFLMLGKPDTKNKEKTVIVFGAPRGGTTMVANVLQSLGIFMGDNLTEVIEDKSISNYLIYNDKSSFEEIVSERNRKYPIWGWKKPQAIKNFNELNINFRNTYIVAIYRDPFAVANRNRISVLADIYKNMESTLNFYKFMTSVIKEANMPVLFCSYEKALLSPESFVTSVTNFLDIQDNILFEKAVKSIEPNSTKYLNHSRITNSKGCVGILNEDFCSGWVLYTKQPLRVVNVEIYIDGQLLDTIQANLFRPDLKASGIHPTGLCGFKYHWPDRIKPVAIKSIEIKAQGDIKSLKIISSK